MTLGEGFQQLLGPEEPDRPLLPERQLADRLPTAVRGSGLVALCDNIPSIHPSIHLFHPRNNIPLREKVQELEGTGSPHPLCTREHSGSGTNNGGSFHCGQHRYHRNRDQQRFRVHNDKLLGVVPRRKSWRRV